MLSAFAGQPLVAQPASQPAAAVANVVEESKPLSIKIEPGTSSMCFFVVATGGTEDARKELKKTLKKTLGGHYNARMKGYRFASNKLAEVCTALQVDQSVDLVDPRKQVEVQFTQKLQWQGDMSIIEQKMKEIGMTKKGAKNTNVYVGDLSLSAKFLQMFNVSPSAHQ